MANKDKKAYKVKRCTFLANMFIAALMEGVLSEPVNMEDGIDFTNRYYTSDRDKEDKDYYITRGFIKRINPTFTDAPTSRPPVYFSTAVSSLSMYTLSTTSYPDEKTESKSYVYFITYLRAALWYSQEEFQKEYPPETYPLVNEKFNLVVQHMKDLGFDIDGIVNGPQE
ncbi:MULTISPECIES: hypothetical protein [Butyricimonas]|uniref:hypothetical protein n=1 Tax=Butyricimonas TaxID=574697 RepID=UPI0007FB327F|nr:MULTISPECIES: hypothetical protein [Butyricimonas]